MKTNQIMGFAAKTVVVGTLLAISCAVLLGAGKQPDTSEAKAIPLRFLVLESKPTDNAASGYQSHLLTVSPHYGKIDQDSLKFRLASETQEIKVIVTTKAGYEFRRGDIVGFALSQHLRLSPGSSVVRHLQSGGQEAVTVTE